MYVPDQNRRYSCNNRITNFHSIDTHHSMLSSVATITHICHVGYVGIQPIKHPKSHATITRVCTLQQQR